MINVFRTKCHGLFIRKFGDDLPQGLFLNIQARFSNVLRFRCKKKNFSKQTLEIGIIHDRSRSQCPCDEPENSKAREIFFLRFKTWHAWLMLIGYRRYWSNPKHLKTCCKPWEVLSSRQSPSSAFDPPPSKEFQNSRGPLLEPSIPIRI